ncbi:MAG: RNA polymerase sigma factor [Alphaproteobacteria bacterium]|nr:RNA polymerase sigma factor [Alphaproteobacteria bacterium]
MPSAARRPDPIVQPSANEATASDDELVRRVADGDASAWSKLIDRHAGAMVRVAACVLGDHAEAEDVAQEAFVRLMAKAGDWAPDGAPLKTWLYRVTINLCIDRTRARRTTPLDDLADFLGDDRQAPAVIERNLALRTSVREALAGLPQRQRMALVLVHYEGLSNREAAGLLELSVDALESLLSRGRRRLKEELADLADELLGE